MYTDTHCHLTSYYNLQYLINDFSKANIKRIIINGYNYHTNQKVIEIVASSNKVYGALGIHPDNIKDFNKKTIDHLKQNITNPKIIAIGEIGLDFYHNKTNKQAQIELLTTLLNIAEQYHKPVIIHNREATNQLISILKQYKVKGIIHCFSGSIETANEYINLGYKLGIGGVVTFNNSNLRQTLKNISLKNILLETDSPYLTPSPLRGIPNEPANINFIIKELEKIYNMPASEIAEILESNYHELFDSNY